MEPSSREPGDRTCYPTWARKGGHNCSVYYDEYSGGGNVTHDRRIEAPISHAVLVCSVPPVKETTVRHCWLGTKGGGGESRGAGDEEDTGMYKVILTSITHLT
jgi:hypothetical protein